MKDAVTYDIQENQLVRLFHGRPEAAWDIDTLKKGNGMKVGDLVRALSVLPQDADVYVWDAGDRLKLVSVDDSFLGDDYPFVDLNTDTDDTKENANA